jgi:hypothetical protein
VKSWDDLVAVALVGVARAAVPPLSGASPALDELAGGLADRAPEARLLAAAAVLATWQRAGAVPAQARVTPPDPAPAGDRPPCPAPAAAHLGRLLGDPSLTPLLGEWLAVLAATGRALPPAWLPELLDLARQNTELRPRIAQALGARGEWLARQNPDWAGLLPVTDRDAILERWATGAFADRLDVLRAVRQTDPDLGRELVASTWEQEPPREREAFLTALGVNLSMADEPLAEAALSDRRKEVRTAAVQLAARLPASRFCRRMTERARPLLAFTPGDKGSLRTLGRSKPARLEVTLPEAYDKAMQRDGIDAKPPPGVQMGERAWWLTEFLAGTPLNTWLDAWPTTPDELVKAAEGEWRDALWLGWAAAAYHQRDAAWADSLLEAALGVLTRVRGATAAEARYEGRLCDTVARYAWFALPAARQEAFLVEAFRTESRDLHDEHLAVTLLNLPGTVWTEQVGRLFLRSLRARTENAVAARFSDWQLRGWLKTYARAIPASLAGEAAATWDRASLAGNPWSSAIDDFLTVLQFRHDMLAALRA